MSDEAIKIILQIPTLEPRLESSYKRRIRYDCEFKPQRTQESCYLTVHGVKLAKKYVNNCVVIVKETLE